MINARHYLSFDRMKDGTPVFVRAIRREDKHALLKAYEHMSDRSIYYRFMRPKWQMSLDEAARFTDVDFESHVAIAAGHYSEKGEEEALGIGRYILLPGSKVKRAEFACAVLDSLQNLGVGSILFQHLLKIAREQGVEEFIAEVLPQNRGMIGVFRRAGLPTRTIMEDGLLRVNMDLRQNREVLESD
ncbi:GNAT family N-acetyltransferase [Gallaecimonas pentaromativorans]|uniref:GNAT family N-acetyltransferase n=1 Tax=Gallaecimonas pentaromativorans TaxID=584787 RepID=UPI00067F38A6|nr:GNAT family N-acetyltransferase [Gallaecimonas pentaromativorans]MED5525547.1 GNAT family N-acetyltransferase [Pseudomonadota bacterium]